MKNRPEKKQTGRVNYVPALAGVYLLYLAYKLFRDAYTSETDIPGIAVVSGIVFAAIGGFLVYREWKAYQYGAAHIDDPSTWNDEVESSEEKMPEEGGEEIAEDSEEERDGEDA